MNTLKEPKIYDYSSFEANIDWIRMGLDKPLANFFRASWQKIGTRERGIDTTAADYSARSRDLGSKVGIYHFLTPQGIAEQAALFLGQWNKIKPDLAPAIDVEIDLGLSGYYVSTRSGGSISNATWQSHVKTFIDLIAAGTGRTPMIYTNKNYWSFVCTKNVLGQFVPPSWTKDYPLWLGWYPDLPDNFSAPTTAMIPAGWTSDQWAMWQYFDKGRQNGFVANDLNVASAWYAEELGQIVLPPPPPSTNVTIVHQIETLDNGKLIIDGKEYVG